MKSFDTAPDLQPGDSALDPRVLQMLENAAQGSERAIRDSMSRADRYIAALRRATGTAAWRGERSTPPPSGPA